MLLLIGLITILRHASRLPQKQVHKTQRFTESQGTGHGEGEEAVGAGLEHADPRHHSAQRKRAVVAKERFEAARGVGAERACDGGEEV